jgi:hypothetical protein
MVAVSTGLAGFVDAVAEAVQARGPDERRWFADWRADFDEAQRDGEGETATLLLDALVAFNAWLCANHDRARP